MKFPSRLLYSTLLPLSLSLVAACDSGGDDPDGGVGDGGTGECPTALPAADKTCDVASCTASGSTKTVGRSELAGSAGSQWLVVTSVSSEFDENADTTVNYLRETAGGLEARRARAAHTSRLTEAEKASIFSKTRLENVAIEAEIRRRALRGPIDAEHATGTAIRGVSDPTIQKQQTACSASAPDCGETALCVIPEGGSDGTCESSLSLKYALLDTGAPDTITGTVRKVGQGVAIVVDADDDASVMASDVDALVQRFEEHIGPFSNQLFGAPAQADKDQNGVVIFLLTSKLRDLGDEFVGIFFSDDMRPTSEAAHSNAADLLYLQPPRTGAINLDQISGTVVHEYQHLLSYTAKVIVGGNADPEAVWLDEGISSFAEDLAGYGEDAFKNVAAYLDQAELTSLTGEGFVISDSPDSIQRRGIAHLLVRHLFESAGGATWSGPGEGTDAGGVARVKGMVTSSNIGFDAVLASNGGRSWDEMILDLMVNIGLDGTGLQCLDGVGFEPPVDFDYTGFQQGLDLRTSITAPSGSNIPLMGPNRVAFETAEDVPIPVNGAEFRTVSVSDGSAVEIQIGGPSDFTIDYEAIAVD